MFRQTNWLSAIEIEILKTLTKFCQQSKSTTFILWQHLFR